MNAFYRRTAALFLLLLCGQAVADAAPDALAAERLKLANPLVGTAIYDGAMYPGAAMPFGMVKLSPDTTKPSSAGYNPAEPIMGFSHTHIGGTGGSTFGGQIRMRPQTGALILPPPPSSKANEVASPGYYSVDLTIDGVRAELTAAERAGVHRYSFPPGKSARVLIDLAALINNASGEKPAGVCTGSSAKFVSDTEAEGQASIKAGLASLAYTVYFVTRFDHAAIARGSWLDATTRPAEAAVTGGANQQAGLIAEFAPGSTITLHVGISFTSVALARRNLEDAVTNNFDQTRTAAESKWAQTLSSISVEGGTDAQRRQFYTALYHTMLAPTDVTGDNANWAADDTPVYYDIHTVWDTFRSTDPLRVLIAPDRERAIIRSLLAVYQKTGWLPDAWAYNKSSLPFQGGSNADNVIADAIVKKLGGFDEQLAYAAVRKNATEYNTNPNVGKTFPAFGRMMPYFKLGYVPSHGYNAKAGPGTKNEWSSGVSRTLEYAYNDFCVSQVAAALGHADDAKTFRDRSLSAYNLFDPSQKLFWGRKADGQFCAPEDPTQLTWGWNNMFYEGSAWQYRFSVPHDVAGLIKRTGGDAAFVGLLDEYFDKKLHYPGNEPGFLTPFMYIYAGRPDKSAERVHAILTRSFKLTPNGYPGDEDVGAMSAYYVLASIGLFPNAGQDVYLVTTPLFAKTTLKLGTSGKTLTILCPNASPENRYVQSATLNGKPLTRAWLRHAEITDGAELILRTGPAASDWGTADRPPSISAAGATPSGTGQSRGE